MKVLLIDNYDSFVFNLAQYVGATGADPVVIRASAPIAQLETVHADAVIISPGPGRPEDAGCSIEAIRHYASRGVPVLGVCLGHQAIGVAYGATVVRAEKVMHGRTSLISHAGEGVFKGLEDPFEATRYHSLVIDPISVPPRLDVTARSEDGTIMGVRHLDLPVEGVQFHPESVLTAEGMKLINNFLESVATP